MTYPQIYTDAVVSVLNNILEAEFAGVVRYTHYSLIVFGYNPIPIISQMRNQTTEPLIHANQAGELITQLNSHPSLGIGAFFETHRHDSGDILRGCLDDQIILAEYQKLLDLVNGRNILLEEYARRMMALKKMQPCSSRQLNKESRKPV